MAITRLNNNSVVSVSSLPSLSTSAIVGSNSSNSGAEKSTTSASFTDMFSLSYTPSSSSNFLLLTAHAVIEGVRTSGDQIKGNQRLTYALSGGSDTQITPNSTGGGVRFYVRYIGGSNNAIGGTWTPSEIIDLSSSGINWSSGAITFKLQIARTDDGTCYLKPNATLQVIEYKG